jgi:shikimate dehydrogenase
MTTNQHGTSRISRIGLIGWPVAHSLSPAMHKAAFLALGLDYSYETIPVEPGGEALLEDTVANLSARGFVGANVTVPHKQTIVRHLHHVSDAAGIIGAVNTINISSNGKLMGDNTDADGFLDTLRQNHVGLDGAQVLVLGSGGSARAIAYALGRGMNARVTILGRSLESALKLVKEISPHGPTTNYIAAPLDNSLQSKIEKVSLVINCTPVGMHGFSEDKFGLANGDLVFNRRQTVYDLVYNPAQTHLLKRAAECGATGIGGIGMLVSQGVRAFEIWTGVKCPVEVMYKAARNQLARQSRLPANEVK